MALVEQSRLRGRGIEPTVRYATKQTISPQGPKNKRNRDRSSCSWSLLDLGTPGGLHILIYQMSHTSTTRVLLLVVVPK